jgi:vacuolar-type H+-ATPase subunit C/Vma6
VRPRWESLAARARGLAGHLLAEARLGGLARAGSVPEVLRLLGETPYDRFLPPTRDAEPAALELAVTRSLAERMALLARWDDAEAPALAVLFLEQDAHNVRLILRGGAGALGPAQRLDGCIPTPTLDRKALEVLARADSPSAVAATLTEWGHPLGSALLDETGETRPDAFRLETALARDLARRSVQEARRAGPHTRRYVAESLDARNVVAALLLADSPSESPPGEVFVEGGAVLDLEAFSAAVATADRARAAVVLAERLRGTLFEDPLSQPGSAPAAMSARIVAARVGSLEREARMEPVSALPVLLFLMRLRDEGRRVREALWRAAVGGGAST